MIRTAFGGSSIAQSLILEDPSPIMPIDYQPPAPVPALTVKQKKKRKVNRKAARKARKKNR